MKRNSFPNILIIYSDQQRQDTLGCYGNKAAHTPNLDKLAGESFRLNNFFVQNPVCMPSRMSFLTGRYPSALRIGSNGVPFPENETCLAEIVKNYGYQTANIGKLHFLPHVNRDHRMPMQENYGFETTLISDEPGCYDDPYLSWVRQKDPENWKKACTSLPPAAKGLHPELSDTGREVHEITVWPTGSELTHSAFVAEKSCDFLKQFRNQKNGNKPPFFLISGFYAPHTPIHPPRECLDKINPAHLPRRIRNDNYQNGGGGELADEIKNLSEKEWLDIRHYYHALCSHVDEQAGKILTALKKYKLKNNTIIIFTSDHGEYLGDYGRIQKGMPGQDCITRVPCLIHLPQKAKQTHQNHQKIYEIVEAVDIAPTLLDAAGIPIPGKMQGKSLLPYLSGREKKHRKSALTEYFEPSGYSSASIRTRKYRYVKESTGKELLFDIQEDPGETTNLSDKKPETKSRMRDILLKRLLESALNGSEKTAPY